MIFYDVGGGELWKVAKLCRRMLELPVKPVNGLYGVPFEDTPFVIRIDVFSYGAPKVRLALAL